MLAKYKVKYSDPRHISINALSSYTSSFMIQELQRLSPNNIRELFQLTLHYMVLTFLMTGFPLETLVKTMVLTVVYFNSFNIIHFKLFKVGLNIFMPIYLYTGDIFAS